MHSSILPQTWLSFMEQCLFFFFLALILHFAKFCFRISKFFGLRTTEETEIHIWYIKIGIVLVLH
jgi:hypothetical protein